MNGSPGERNGRRGPGMGTGLAVGCLVGVLGMCGLGAAGLYLIGSKLGLVADGDGGLGELVLLVVVLLAVAAGHVGAIVWAWRTRPKLVAVALTQVPHLAAYAAVPVWWSGTWPVWWILWVAAALAAAGWLTVWYLADPGRARRAVVYLAALAMLVVVNAGGILATGWQRTNGFGWKGQPTPWAAFIALTSTSCLSENHFHNDGSRVVEADCIPGPGGDFYSGDYDRDAFDELLCQEQPRSAFEKWWQWTREYQFSYRLIWDQHATTVDGRDIPPPYPEPVSGDSATIEYVLNIDGAIHLGPGENFQMEASDITESWRVEFTTVAIGGWKVCRIDIADPIRAAFRKN